MRKTAKRGGIFGLVVAAVLTLAKLVNAVTGEHTIANKATDAVLSVPCELVGAVADVPCD